jgi:hypothetical protein
MKSLEEFQKGLEKEFDLAEVVTTLGNVLKAYGHGYNLSSAVTDILYKDLVNLGLVDKSIISKSAYIKIKVYEDENGYGNYGTPKKQYAKEWQEMIDEEEYKKLIELNLNIDYDKKLKKITNLIIKKIGKKNAAFLAFKKMYYNTGSSYDRTGAFGDFISKRLNKIWDNKSDIYKVLKNGKGSANDLVLYKYIQKTLED